MDLTKVDGIIDGYDGDKSWLVMMLQDVQEQLNYLPAEAIKHVAARLNLGLGHVYNVATFYASLSLTERGKHIIKVCDGTACHLRNSDSLLGSITRLLGIEEGQTTEDKLFTLEVVACLGACALAPVMMINDKYHGKMTIDKIMKLVKECAEQEQVAV